MNCKGDGLVKAIVKVAALMGFAFLGACNTSGTQSENSVAETLQLGQQNQETEQAAVQDLRAFCPKPIIRAGTETYRTFEDGVTRDDPGALNALRFQATVTELARECNYLGGTLGMRIGIKGRVINGPTGATGTIETPVRVAVVNTAKEVLYSRLHKVPVTIPEGATTARFSFIDEDVLVPAPTGRSLIVYVGFDEGPPEQ